jgi:hypothetical protein
MRAPNRGAARNSGHEDPAGLLQTFAVPGAPNEIEGDPAAGNANGGGEEHKPKVMLSGEARQDTHETGNSLDGERLDLFRRHKRPRNRLQYNGVLPRNSKG